MGRLAVFLRLGAVAVLLGLLPGLLLGLLPLHAEPGAVLAGVAAVVAATLLTRLVGVVPVAPAGSLSGPALQARSATTATDPQRDPGAAGRPRPRAPSRDPLTA